MQCFFIVFKISGLAWTLESTYLSWQYLIRYHLSCNDNGLGLIETNVPVLHPTVLCVFVSKQNFFSTLDFFSNFPCNVIITMCLWCSTRSASLQLFHYKVLWVTICRFSDCRGGSKPASWRVHTPLLGGCRRDVILLSKPSDLQLRAERRDRESFERSNVV